MKLMHRHLFLLIGVVLAATAGPLLYADEHQHQHADHAPAKLQLNHGKKWPTDAALRKGMETLRARFAERSGVIHKGTLPATDYKLLGDTVETEVTSIVAQCKLEPQADAMLHIVIADLLVAAATLQGKTADDPAAAAHQVITALNSYGRYFEHPHWRPLK